jgi:hypothetical protein
MYSSMASCFVKSRAVRTPQFPEFGNEAATFLAFYLTLSFTSRKIALWFDFSTN